MDTWRIEMGRICPVCGWNGLGSLPWCDGGPSYEICDCCSAEFGFDDIARDGATTATYEELRATWIANGMPWFYKSPPEGWDPERQVERVASRPERLAQSIEMFHKIRLPFSDLVSGEREIAIADLRPGPRFDPAKLEKRLYLDSDHPVEAIGLSAGSDAGLSAAAIARLMSAEPTRSLRGGPPTPEMAEVLEILAAQVASANWMEDFGIELTGQPSDLTKLDELLEGGSQFRRRLSNFDGCDAYRCVGAYVGQLLQRELGAAWWIDPDDLLSELGWAMRLPSGAVIWPTQRVHKKGHFGSLWSLESYGVALGVLKSDSLRVVDLPRV
jgi:hypothetical protein